MRRNGGARYRRVSRRRHSAPARLHGQAVSRRQRGAQWVEAALLPKRFTADPAIFEAPRGFCDTFFGKDACDYEKMITNIGKPFFLESPGLGLKMHPCSAPQFLAADAALHLKREHKIDFAEVAKIEVRIPPERYQRHFHAEVKTGLRGKFAINYVVALALLDGKLEITTFTDEKVNQPSQDALSKVQVICGKRSRPSYCRSPSAEKRHTRLATPRRSPEPRRIHDRERSAEQISQQRGVGDFGS
jgi:2-methylcitrate dehydratase PrpD